MKMKTPKTTFVAATSAICAICATLTVASTRVTMPSEHMRNIQYSDIAGIGTIATNIDGFVKISDISYWLGNYPTNEISIFINDDWFSWGPDGISFPLEGRKAVFFAMTNEWKESSLGEIRPDQFFWGLPQTFTNFGPSCVPMMLDASCQTVFVISTNSTEQVDFFSNITQAIFYTQDQRRFYEVLRDAIRFGKNDYMTPRAMAVPPFVGMMNSASESNLVETLNDTLLPRHFREHALSSLQKRFNWPATNTVPVP
jgi:hypothetical protein